MNVGKHNLIIGLYISGPVAWDDETHITWYITYMY